MQRDGVSIDYIPHSSSHQTGTALMVAAGQQDKAVCSLF